MSELSELYLSKAQESLAGAESEFANGRYNNCANRCYFACFQAAICALLQAGVQPRGSQTQWSHAYVQAEFVGQLVNRRKVYSGNLCDVLMRTLLLRQAADYSREWMTETHMARTLRRVRGFLADVQAKAGV